MDKHSFNVARYVEGSKIPTWHVEVYRQGVDAPVDLLLLDNITFPPRKRKGKVVWKLPDNSDTIPKFGEYERQRLYEMFKKQKKERRKKKKKQSQKGNDNTLVPHNGANEGSTNTADISPAESDSDDESSDTSNHGEIPPPPPGFGVSHLTLDDSAPRSKTSTGGTAKPVKTRSNGTTQLPSTPFDPTNNDTSYSTAKQPSDAPVSLPSTDLKVPVQYFTLPLNQPPQALAASVAAIFIQSLPAGNLLSWIGYYLPSCPKVLLMGSAQAACVSPQDRLAQWQSLANAPWECQGWTIQTLAGVASESNYLVVLTGRTIQRETECLAYNLTLVLTRVSGPKNDLEQYYRIGNEVLSLHTMK
jgi:hypothetical protein